MADRKKLFNELEVAFLYGIAVGAGGIIASFLITVWTQ